MTCSIEEFEDGRDSPLRAAVLIEGDCLASEPGSCRDDGENSRIQKSKPLHFAGGAFRQLFQEVNS